MEKVSAPVDSRDWIINQLFYTEREREDFFNFAPVENFQPVAMDDSPRRVSLQLAAAGHFANRRVGERF